MVKSKATGYSVTEWRRIFGAIAKWCSKNKSPGERMADCMKRAIAAFKAGTLKVTA